MPHGLTMTLVGHQGARGPSDRCHPNFHVEMTIKSFWLTARTVARRVAGLGVLWLHGGGRPRDLFGCTRGVVKEHRVPRHSTTGASAGSWVPTNDLWGSCWRRVPTLIWVCQSAFRPQSQAVSDGGHCQNKH